MMRANFDRWIFKSYEVTPEGLGLYRMMSALMILLFLMPDSNLYPFLSSLPDSLFIPPPGPMMFLSGFPPEPVFWIIHFALITSLVFMLIGYKTKVSSILSGLFMMLLLGFIFSIGKINHIHTGVVLVPIVMAFSNWGAAYSLDAKLNAENNRVESWPLALLALMIGFMMFTAGTPKILGGWLSPESQAAQSHFLNQFFAKDRNVLLAQYALNINSELFWEILDWATILFEMGFLIAVIKAQWFKRFVCFAVIFHFSTMVLMNITFLSNLVAYAAFLNWTVVHKSIVKIFKQKNISEESDSIPFLVGLLMAGLFSVLWWVSQKTSDWMGPEINLYEFFFLSAGLVVVLFLTARISRQKWKDLIDR